MHAPFIPLAALLAERRCGGKLACYVKSEALVSLNIRVATLRKAHPHSAHKHTHLPTHLSRAGQRNEGHVSICSRCLLLYQQQHQQQITAEQEHNYVSAPVHGCRTTAAQRPPQTEQPLGLDTTQKSSGQHHRHRHRHRTHLHAGA